jgi:drug/metabolite transporter (DMT)-like permease
VKEGVKPLQWLFFAMAFSGVILIQGFDARVSIEYLMLGIGSAVFSALAYNMIRMLKDSEHPLVIVFYFPLVTLPITGFFTLFNFEMPQGSDWIIILAVGILAQLGQYFMTRAYQVDELSKISSMKYLGIIYALFFGAVFFDEHFTLQVYLGIGVVLVGVVLNIWYKHVIQKRKKLEELE